MEPFRALGAVIALHTSKPADALRKCMRDTGHAAMAARWEAATHRIAARVDEIAKHAAKGGLPPVTLVRGMLEDMFALNRVLWSRATLDVMAARPCLPSFIDFIEEQNRQAITMLRKQMDMLDVVMKKNKTGKKRRAAA